MFLEEEVELIRKMNSKAIVAIDTPVGYTNEITLHDIVRQGTIIGPALCIVETDQINDIGERCYTTYGPEIRINNLLYVDDIVGVGSPMVRENTVRHLKLLEERKVYIQHIKIGMVKTGNRDGGYRGTKT